jgi:hypothetical protein
VIAFSFVPLRANPKKFQFPVPDVTGVDKAIAMHDARLN